MSCHAMDFLANSCHFAGIFLLPLAISSSFLCVYWFDIFFLLLLLSTLLLPGYFSFINLLSISTTEWIVWFKLRRTSNRISSTKQALLIHVLSAEQLFKVVMASFKWTDFFGIVIPTVGHLNSSLIHWFLNWGLLLITVPLWSFPANWRPEFCFCLCSRFQC